MSTVTLPSPTHREPELLGQTATYDIDGGQQFVAA
jgi:hypothetical protein